MNHLIEELEIKNNKLDFVKSKIKYLTIFKNEEIEPELLILTNETIDLKRKAEKITDIQTQKELLFNQLTEYIKKLEKDYNYPFSKSQGLSFPFFYISPLMDIKNILFLDLKGISGVILKLTLDEKDAVNNKTEFLNFLKEKRNEFYKSENLYELYSLYKKFSEGIKINFL
jgi:hypothetical protein